MNRKYFPVIIMLAAGLLTCIFTYLRHDPLLQKLITLLVVLVVFYALGNAVSGILNFFDRQNEERLSEEMIEKEAEIAATEETQGQQQQQQGEA